MSAYTDEQRSFLTGRKQAVLATGRPDGSPQISTVAYVVVDDDVVVSTKSYTAKWRNARRRPQVALLVGDGHAQLTIYGSAQCIDADPERAALSAKVFAALTGEAVEPASIVPVLDQQQRTILRIRPRKVLMNE